VWTGGFILGTIYFVARVGFDLVNNISPVAYDVVAGVMLVLLVIYGWARSVKRYIVGDDGVTIERSGPGRMRIAADTIARVEASPNVGSFYNMTPLSIGGLFGWAGNARIRNATDVRADQAEVYGTNAKKAVALHLKSGRVVIVTPDDPEGFAFALQSKWHQNVTGERQRASGKKSKRKAR
jgi:hypothetical protein